MTNLSPDVRSGPKGVSGEISAIDTTKRTLALRTIDEKGYEIITGFFWRESKDLDTTMQKQKQGWYVALTYEVQGERNMLSDCKYAERPANMKRKGNQGGGGRGQYVPKNEKPVVYQSVFKTVMDHATFSPETYPEEVRKLWALSKEIGNEIIQLSGA